MQSHTQQSSEGYEEQFTFRGSPPDMSQEKVF